MLFRWFRYEYCIHARMKCFSVMTCLAADASFMQTSLQGSSPQRVNNLRVFWELLVLGSEKQWGATQMEM